MEGDRSIKVDRRIRASSRGLRILIFDVHGHLISYKLKCSTKAFEKLGHKVRRFDLAKAGKSPRACVNAVLMEVNRFKPDLVFTIDHIFTTDPIGLIPQVLSKIGIPTASWFSNNPFYYPWVNDRSATPSCCFFSWDRTYVKRLKERGFENVFHLPLCTNPENFYPRDHSDLQTQVFSSTVSFAGSSFYPDLKACLDACKGEADRRFVMEVLKVQARNPHAEISEIIQAKASELKVDPLRLKLSERTEEVEKQMEFASQAIRRRDLLEYVAESFELHLFGDVGWLKLIHTPIRFSGWADCERELPLLYNATKVNLNITLSQLKTGVPIRVYDVSACGRFILTDIREELKDLYEIGREIVTYEDKADLKEKISYFLKHERERDEISSRARARTLSDHTYINRMRQVINTMKSLFGEKMGRGA